MKSYINLYEYQKNVIEACQKDPSHSQLISMPTGTGKTITFLSLAKKLNKKTLIIVHREELLNQTYDKAKLCGFEENEISIVNAEKKEKLNKLCIAMVQSLNRNLEKYHPDDVEMVIVDEAHHATANSYKNIFNFFKIFDEKKLLFGFTATPLRGDKEHLQNIFHSHSFKMTLSEATRLGYIVPVQGVRMEIFKSLKDIDTTQGDYDITQLDKIMNCDAINELIVQRCKYLGKTPGIIFCTSVDHAEKLALMLRKEKRKAISVSYKTSKKNLERIFSMLKRGSIDFITNAVKLSEGFDHPPIKSVIVARPTRSPVLYKQMIGRGLRNSPNKEDCYVLEFSSNDPKMLKWEDIDETCTFQSVSPEKQKTMDEAKQHYRNLFKNPNVEILDVRVSPFDFYECKIQRIIKYKDWYFIPDSNSFSLYSVKNAKGKGDIGGNYFYMYGSFYIWKEKYKSFYNHGECDFLMNPKGSQPMHELIKGMKSFSKMNKLGSWYPSDIQPTTRRQKKLMEFLGMKWDSIKCARKAEMEIEEKIIRKIIDTYMSKGIFLGLLEVKMEYRK